ncbi:MAG: hypothetical protein J0H17_18735 [Rhizobiales bacterium]|nr:hypothetical protein [Hyphomicrobiales bacterium]
MTPADAIAMLDRQLAAHGEDVVLRRGLAAAPTKTGTVRAFVRGYKPEELVSGITQKDSLAVVSPTGLAAISWPGDVIEGDFVTINGRARRVAAVGVFKVAGTPARYELQVTG